MTFPDVTPITQALGLFSSCIKSGEDWSPQCEAALIKARAAVESLQVQLAEIARLAAPCQINGCQYPELTIVRETLLREVLANGHKRGCRKLLAAAGVYGWECSCGFDRAVALAAPIP